jgi:hypothetical protein
MQRLVTSRYSFLQLLCGTTGVACIDMLRKTLNVCANRRDRDKFKGNESVAFLGRSVRKWDRQCMYFGFLILTSSSNSSVLLYYYPNILPYSRLSQLFLLWVELLCPLSIEVHVPCCQPQCHKCWRLANMIYSPGCDLIIILRLFRAACGLLQWSLVMKI